VIFIDPESAKKHLLFKTPEIDRDVSAHREKYNCSHTEMVLTRKRAGTQVQTRNQCKNCGQAVGQAFKYTASHDSLPQFDEGAYPAFETKLRNELEEIL
jgi:hypothetical protein